MDSFPRIVPGLRCEQESDVVRFRLMRPAEGEKHANLCSDSERSHGSLRQPGVSTTNTQRRPDYLKGRLGELILTHPFSSMAGQRMDDFMPHDRSKSGFRFRDREDSCVDRNLASRERKSVRSAIILDDGHFPLELIRHFGVFGVLGRLDHAASDALDRLHFPRILGLHHFGIVRHLLIGLRAQLHLLRNGCHE